MRSFLRKWFGRRTQEVPIHHPGKPLTRESMIVRNWRSHNFGRDPSIEEVSAVKKALDAFERRELKPSKSGVIIPEGFNSMQIQVFNSLRYHVQTPQLMLGPLHKEKKRK